MKSHDSQMSTTASIYAKGAREGFVRTSTGPSYAQSDEKARQTTPNSQGRASPAATRLTHEQVAERARALWLASGCLPGRDKQNWLEAEAQLKAELKSR